MVVKVQQNKIINLAIHTMVKFQNCIIWLCHWIEICNKCMTIFLSHIDKFYEYLFCEFYWSFRCVYSGSKHNNTFLHLQTFQSYKMYFVSNSMEWKVCNSLHSFKFKRKEIWYFTDWSAVGNRDICKYHRHVKIKSFIFILNNRILFRKIGTKTNVTKQKFYLKMYIHSWIGFEKKSHTEYERNWFMVEGCGRI